jgi:hypothetical protein
MRARRVGLVCFSALLATAIAVSFVLGTGAVASDATQGVRLVLGHRTYRAGRSIAVTVVNDTRSQILRGMCLALQRRVAPGWVTVTRTHGVTFPCLPVAGVPQAAHTRAPIGLPLYDDLAAGEYRVTLRYKFAHGTVLGNLSGPAVRSVHGRLTVLAYRPGPRPTLSEQRILRLGRRAARQDGDPRPTLVQHTAGTRFDAVLISSGDLVFAYNWAYLIAVRGHFVGLGAPLPAGAKPPRGTVITLVVDAQTGEVADSGIGNRYPPLAELGPVSTDFRAAPDGQPRAVAHPPR